MIELVLPYPVSANRYWIATCGISEPSHRSAASRSLAMIKFVPVNERGKRIGEGHPRAKLSDHEIELLFSLLDARKVIIAECKAKGMKWSATLAHLRSIQMSREFIAQKFEISRSYLINVEAGRKRAQFPRRWKRVQEPT